MKKIILLVGIIFIFVLMINIVSAQTKVFVIPDDQERFFVQKSIEEVLGGSEESKEFLDIGIVDSQNMEDMVDNDYSIESITRSIERIRYFIDNEWLSADSKRTGEKMIADLYFMRASAKSQDVLPTFFEIQRKSETEFIPGAVGCRDKSYPKINVKIELKDKYNYKGIVVGKEKKVSGWKYRWEEEYRNICDLNADDSVGRRAIHNGYRSMFISICLSKGDVEGFYHAIRKDYYEVEGTRIVDTAEYISMKEDFDKAIENLEILRNFYINKDMSIPENAEGLSSIYLSLGKYQNIMGDYEKSFQSYISIFNKIPFKFMSDEDISNIYLKIAEVRKNAKIIEGNSGSMAYLKLAIETYPENLEAKEFKRIFELETLEVIFQGISQKYNELIRKSGWFGTWSDASSREYSLAANTEEVIKSLNDDEKDIIMQKLGVEFLIWAVQDGYDLKTFYYYDTPLPEEYTEELWDSYVADIIEVPGMTPKKWIVFCKNQKDPEWDGDETKPNAIMLDIDIRALKNYTIDYDKNSEAIKVIVKDILKKRSRDNDRNDLEVRKWKSYVDHAIRKNGDLAFLAAMGDTDLERTLLHTMGDYKPGACYIKKEKGPQSTGSFPSENIVFGEYYPETHFEWNSYLVDKNLLISDFQFEGGDFNKKWYKYHGITDTWGDFFGQFVSFRTAIGVLASIGVTRMVTTPYQGIYRTAAGAAGKVSIAGRASAYANGKEFLRIVSRPPDTGSRLTKTLRSWTLLKRLQEKAPRAYRALGYTGGFVKGVLRWTGEAGVTVVAAGTAEVTLGPLGGESVGVVADAVFGRSAVKRMLSETRILSYNKGRRAF